MNERETWRASGKAEAALREWGDEWAVYVGSTGQTHLLSAVAGRLLSELQAREPITSLALLSALAHSPAPHTIDSADDAAAQESTVRAMLLELERIGLATMRSP